MDLRDYLCGVPVKDFARHLQHRIGQGRKDALRQIDRWTMSHQEFACRRGESPIGQESLRTGPMALELNESRIVEIGPAKVEDLSSARLGLPYRFRQEERHGAKPMVGSIRTSILVNGDVFEAKSNKGGNRCALIRSEMKL